MIRKLFTNNRITSSTIFSSMNFFGSGHHHAPIPQKLQKVQKKLIYLYIRNIDSVYQKVPAFEGQSLLETITRMGIRGFESNICHGYDATYRPHVRPHDPFSDGPQCGGCRVILEDNWFKRVNQETMDMSDQQKLMLSEYNIDPQANTRLACCVPIQKWMQGMTLSIDPVATEGGQSVIY